jgi:NitT/TauT family transport system substrate-binding protein
MKHASPLGALGLAALAAALAAPVPASAEAARIRLVHQSSLGYLPLIVVEHDKLIEKYLVVLGLEGVKVEWVDAGGDAGEALTAGKADVTAGPTTTFISQWGRSHGGIKSVGALAEYPLLLNTSNPDVHTIADFTAKDKIAVPRAGSASAVTLKAAAAQKWGAGESGKLDAFTVNMSHPDAQQALLGGKDGVDAHVAPPRMAAAELRDGKVHTVLSSYDVWGPHTGNMAWATPGFVDGNPKIYEALSKALAEAVYKINDDKNAVARTYVDATHDKDGVEAIVAVLNNPDVHYTLTPHNLMKQVQFQHDQHALESVPASWKDLFFPNAWKLRGS